MKKGSAVAPVRSILKNAGQIMPAEAVPAQTVPIIANKMLPRSSTGKTVGEPAVVPHSWCPAPLRRFLASFKSKLTSPIIPDHRAKVYWDGVVVIYVIYVSLMVPYELCFGEPGFSTAFDISTDIVFLMDIWFSFRTSFKNRNTGKYERESKVIARRYLKSWFVVDMAASVPIETIFALLASTTAHLSLGTSQTLKFLKLGRILRLLRLSTLWHFLQRFKFTAVFRLLRLFFLYCFISHWIACMWYAIPYVEAKLDLGTWYSGYCSGISPCDNWITAIGLQNAPAGARYIASLYWAFTTIATVGYGDIHAITSLEQVYSMFVMTCGTIIYSMLFGSMTALIASLNIAESRYREKMQEVNSYLTDNQFPKELKTKIRGYYDFIWERCRDLSQAKALEGIPVHLQSQVARCTHNSMLKMSPAFEHMPEPFLQLFALKLAQHFMMPDEVIFSARELASDLYFVRYGSVVILKASCDPTEIAPHIPSNLKGTALLANTNDENDNIHRLSSITSNIMKQIAKSRKSIMRARSTSPTALPTRAPSSSRPKLDERILSIRTEGEYFGDDAVINEALLVPQESFEDAQHSVYVNSAQTTTYAELYSISFADLGTLFSLYPKEAKLLQNIASLRRKRALKEEAYDDRRLVEDVTSAVVPEPPDSPGSQSSVDAAGGHAATSAKVGPRNPPATTPMHQRMPLSRRNIVSGGSDGSTRSITDRLAGALGITTSPHIGDLRPGLFQKSGRSMSVHSPAPSAVMHRVFSKATLDKFKAGDASGVISSSNSPRKGSMLKGKPDKHQTSAGEGPVRTSVIENPANSPKVIPKANPFKSTSSVVNSRRSSNTLSIPRKSMLFDAETQGAIIRLETQMTEQRERMDTLFQLVDSIAAKLGARAPDDDNGSTHSHSSTAMRKHPGLPHTGSDYSIGSYGGDSIHPYSSFKMDQEQKAALHPPLVHQSSSTSRGRPIRDIGPKSPGSDDGRPAPFPAESDAVANAVADAMAAAGPPLNGPVRQSSAKSSSLPPRPRARQHSGVFSDQLVEAASSLVSPPHRAAASLASSPILETDETDTTPRPQSQQSELLMSQSLTDAYAAVGFNSNLGLLLPPPMMQPKMSLLSLASDRSGVPSVSSVGRGEGEDGEGEEGEEGEGEDLISPVSAFHSPPHRPDDE